MTGRTALLFIATALSTTALATGYSQDSGSISELYTNEAGAIAIKLSGGFPNAIASGQCIGSNGWAGNNSPTNSSLKASLLTAKALGSTVVITIQGCEGGSWFKIVDMYMK